MESGISYIVALFWTGTAKLWIHTLQFAPQRLVHKSEESASSGIALSEIQGGRSKKWKRNRILLKLQVYKNVCSSDSNLLRAQKMSATILTSQISFSQGGKQNYWLIKSCIPITAHCFRQLHHGKVSCLDTHFQMKPPWHFTINQWIKLHT